MTEEVTIDPVERYKLIREGVAKANSLFEVADEYERRLKAGWRPVVCFDTEDGQEEGPRFKGVAKKYEVSIEVDVRKVIEEYLKLMRAEGLQVLGGAK